MAIKILKSKVLSLEESIKEYLTKKNLIENKITESLASEYDIYKELALESYSSGIIYMLAVLNLTFNMDERHISEKLLDSRADDDRCKNSIIRVSKIVYDDVINAYNVLRDTPNSEEKSSKLQFELFTWLGMLAVASEFDIPYDIRKIVRGDEKAIDVFSGRVEIIDDLESSEYTKNKNRDGRENTYYEEREENLKNISRKTLELTSQLMLIEAHNMKIANLEDKSKLVENCQEGGIYARLRDTKVIENDFEITKRSTKKLVDMLVQGVNEITNDIMELMEKDFL